MPYIISTPEEWFRIQQRDLYVIQYRAPVKENEDDIDDDESPFKQVHKQAQIALNAWFNERLPNTPLTIIGASEYSGWLIGGPAYFTADFDLHGLSLFKSDWGDTSSLVCRSLANFKMAETY